jgi:hypothetical protein
MNEKHVCYRQLLSHGSLASIERCSCGTLHVVLGPFTLRLSADQFKSLFVTMLEAQSSLQDEAEKSREATQHLASLLGQSAARGES